jgi:hypothetical protein
VTGLGSLRPGPTGDGVARRFLASLLLTWAVLTVLGITVLAVTRWGPANRLLVFAFFLPIAAAIGTASLVARRRGLLTGAAVLGAAAFAVTSMGGWYRQSPSFAPEELALATAAGRVIEGLEPGTPAIILVDTSEPAAAFHVTRFGNVIRMGMPPDRMADSYLVVGHPDDFLAGRPTANGDPEHDRIALVYFREAEPVRERAAVLVLDLFNSAGYEEAKSIGSEVAPGVVTLRGSETAKVQAAPATDAELGGVELVLLSVAALALLGLLGLGWARWALSAATAAMAAAPAVGLGIAVIAGFVVDRIAPGAAAPWGLPAAVALAVGGYVAAARGRRHRA